jgi:hypothetical protein
LDVGPYNDTRQAESADRRPQHVWVFVRAAENQIIVRTIQCNALNMRTKRPGTVMVLAVHVVGDGAPHGHKGRPRRDGQKPTFGQKDIEDFGQADTAFATHDSRGFVETENTVETAAFDEFAVAVQARIAIAASQTKGKQ